VKGSFNASHGAGDERETLLSHTFVSANGSPSHPKAKITTTLDFCTTLF
jgi:hypothetical protein